MSLAPSTAADDADAQATEIPPPGLAELCEAASSPPEDPPRAGSAAPPDDDAAAPAPRRAPGRAAGPAKPSVAEKATLQARAVPGLFI